MEGKGSGPQRRGPLFRFLAATLLVVMYAVSMLGVSGFALTAGSASAEARSRGGGRGRGRGRGRSMGRGRGGIFFGGALIGGGVGYCTYWSNQCADYYGWGGSGYYRCMRGRGC